MIALRVYNDEAMIASLRAQAENLKTDARVRITLDDGQVFRGIVRRQPSIEEGADHEGNSGVYAIVTLNSADGQPLVVVYLDRIIRVDQEAAA